MSPVAVTTFVFQFPRRRESLLSILGLSLEKIPASAGTNIVTYRKTKYRGKVCPKLLKRVAPPLAGRGAYTSLRAISTARLRTLLPIHLRPINVVVSHGPLKKSHLVVGFALICFQRLSLPDVATQRCPWRDNWRTSGRSNPVLSY